MQLYGQTNSDLSLRMLDGFSRQLSSDPDNYEALYQRGALYYKMARYEDAFNDINKALQLTPKDNRTLIASEYSILADIWAESGSIDDALREIDKAISTVGPTELLLYKKGELLIEDKKGHEAVDTFKEMCKLYPASSEALWGLARAEAINHNFKESEKIMTQAMADSPDSYVNLCRRADVYSLAGEYNLSAGLLIDAYLKSPETGRALKSLCALAPEHYSEIEQALSDIGEGEELLLLKARVATAASRYVDAYDIYYSLNYDSVSDKDGQLSYETAEAAFNSGKYAAASRYIDTALQRKLLPRYLILKSAVSLAQGKSGQALSEAVAALNGNTDKAESNIQAAICCMAMLKGTKALEYLNESLKIKPINMKALMLRAFVNFQLLNNSREAVLDYLTVSRMLPKNWEEKAYIGMSLCYSGNVKNGYDMMDDAMKNGGLNNSFACYYAGMFYSQTGDLNRGAEMIDKAIELGFQNNYELLTDKIANLNIAPIRHLLNR